MKPTTDFAVMWLAILAGTASRLLAADLVVTNASDTVNGTTASPAALVANPGADGISLREAIQACNNTAGPHSITFFRSLAGATIALTSGLKVTRDGVTITGFLKSDGLPAVIIDGDNIPIQPQRVETPNLSVYASDFKISRLIMTGTRAHGVLIAPGELVAPPFTTIRNIRIEDMIFDNAGVGTPTSFPRPISVLTSNNGRGTDNLTSNATVANVTIARNTFRNFTDSGIIVNANGYASAVQNLIIDANRFADIPFQLELAVGRGANNRIIGTRVTNNTFVNGIVPVYIGALGNDGGGVATTDGAVDGTIVSGNLFRGALDSIDLQIFTEPQGAGALRNSVSNTQIFNNVIVAGQGIGIGANGVGSVGNGVQGVQIFNNTILTFARAGVRAFANSDGASANSIAGVIVRNTVLQKANPEAGRPEELIAGEITPSQVGNSIAPVSGFAGINGNISADPAFVDLANGNYHLRAGSPAIDAGTSDGAPTTDLEGRPRFDDPTTPNTGVGTAKFFDIGAYEFAPVLTSGRLVNLSILTSLDAPGDTFTVGTVLGGGGTGGTKPLLVRAAGPSLTPLGVGGALADPRLDLFSGTSIVATNDNWGGGGALSAAFAQVGAFAFSSATSRDAAAVFTANAAPPPASYTVQVSGNGGTGTALAEIYDATPAAAFTVTTPRLLNVSVLKNIGASLTTGFVIGGTTPVKVLVRAVGPSLGPLFGVSGAMADPKLELFDSAAKSLAANNDWAGAAPLAAAFAQVGAFALDPASKDAALVASLPPGSYTVQVKGADGGTGEALVEIYEVP